LPGGDVIEEFIISAYAIMNSLRIFAYLPQIVTVLRASDRAEAVSLLTWTFWTLANIATTAYSAVILEDVLSMVIFAGNSVCCALVVSIVGWKRKRYSSARAHNPSITATVAHDDHRDNWLCVAMANWPAADGSAEHGSRESSSHKLGGVTYPVMPYRTCAAWHSHPGDGSLHEYQATYHSLRAVRGES
jgi:hypothetical protein